VADAPIDDEVRTACARGDHTAAASLVVRAHKTEIVAYLGSLTRNQPQLLDDAFSSWCEDIVRGLPSFRFASSVRTWTYTVARHACARCARDDQRRLRRLAGDDVPVDIAAAIRSETADYLRTAMKDRLAQVRAELADDERELLYLRIDRQVPWREIETIVRAADAADDDAACRRREQALRKRFESLKRRIKARLA
jgi:RNA polymerase sigma-70 factor (ECF subfamily)